MRKFTTIHELLDAAPADSTAISAPDADSLSYGQLTALVRRSVAHLNALGIGRSDRVALLMPNGALAATAFLSVASAAVAAPLNPGYRAAEIEFYLTDLKARALIIEQGSTSPAAEVAQRLGVRVLVLETEGEAGAGAFHIRGGDPGMAGAEKVELARPGDTALILHTSGTTSRPKIVPLTHTNVCASACNVRNTLQLGPGDTGLNIMPLFHIHGLIAGLLAPLSGAGRVYCTPGFNALKFFAWMQQAHPTWYTAVPTMHQAILARAGGNRDIIGANPLRFLRSSSSSMPPQVIRDLEEVFTAPLVEAYGMTEAAHQMASNPLPPGQRKPGTVGPSGGPEIALLDSAGDISQGAGAGEIVIRGPNVTNGYENNPKANADAFVQGWFRTGDLGTVDADGYVSITGRIKEIINRGGEKISPREIDEILMDHPAVNQVVTFGIPHAKLGEEVGVVVVLKEGRAATDREIRAFVAERAADFKVPATVLFMEEIPKGPTGKLQRIGLAQKLGLTAGT